MQLTELCAGIKNSPAIFLDTEFVSEGRYYPDLGTIQIAAEGYLALIDPLTIRDFSPFFTLLVHPKITKVFHAATHDLAIFFRMMETPVFPVFDTQIAAALLGIDEQISFGNLVEKITGERLQKSHSFTDWLRRPLSAGQIDYALDDVKYLMPVYTTLYNNLCERQRLAWAREEFQRLEDTSRFTPTDPREVYLRIKGVERLNATALSLLRELAAWREETARLRNIPTSRIVRDEVLIELARRPRFQVKELREIRGVLPQQIEQYGRELVTLMSQGAQEMCPNFKRQQQLPSSLEPTVDFLALCLRSLASAKVVSPGVLATRGDLAALIQSGEQANIPLMRGWRREAIGDDLLATLQGRATARIIPGSRVVHLDWHDASKCVTPMPEK